MTLPGTTGSRALFFALVASALLAQTANAAEAANPQQQQAKSDQQETGTEGVPGNSAPGDDVPELQDIQNPRIVVQENLEQMPDVRTVLPEGEDGTEAQTDGESSVDSMPESKQDVEDLKENLNIESANKDRKILGKTDRFMELTRKPLTYAQEHIPVLTKRNIIFFGRLEFDGALYNGGVLDDEDDFIMRRFRLGVAGQIIRWPGWNYKLEMDLTDGENTLSDFYISRRFEKWGTIRIGNQRVAQTLSGQTSSLSISFMERPLPVLAFTLKRRLGIGWDTHLKKLGANVTIFSKDPNEGTGSGGWAARGYFNPTRNNFQVLHVGASMMQLSSENDAQLRARPESHATNIRLVDTGVWPEVDVGSALGLELAGSRGGVTFKSEFYRTEWSRKDAENPNFKGWYGEAAWFITGETALYRDGKFIRPNILSDNGAWQVALRFSTINLNDQEIQGGKQNNLAFSVNWYSRTHWRFNADLIKVKAEDGPYGEQDSWVGQVRAQYFF